MRIRNKIFPIIAGFLGLGMVLGSCTKFTKVQLASEGTIYMVQAEGTKGQLELRALDTAQMIVFGAAYGGLNYPSSDIPVTFKVDTSLVATYNSIYGTSYLVLPSSAYSIASLSSVIKAGTTSSQPLYVGILANKLDPSKQYMLPITLVNATTSKVDSSLTTAYFTVDHIDNLYAGSYHTVGVRTNYNADGTNAGTNSIDDTRVLTTMTLDSCSINTIANLGSYNGTVFFVRVNPDNTLEFSGYLQNVIGSPIGNQPNTTSTYNPTTGVMTVHYMYTNTNGTYRYMDETWTPD